MGRHLKLVSPLRMIFYFLALSLAQGFSGDTELAKNSSDLVPQSSDEISRNVAERGMDDPLAYYDEYDEYLNDETVQSASKRVSNIAKQATKWINENIPKNYKKKAKLVRAIERVKVKLQYGMSKGCAIQELESESELERIDNTLLGLRISTDAMDQVMRFTSVWKKLAESYLKNCARLPRYKGKIFKFQKQFSNHLSKVHRSQKQAQKNS